jgi:heme a synthase
VTVGGITRLTRSGLSMTDWKLQGSFPPMSEEEWTKEFERYQTFPEYQQRQGMSVEEFKSIYWWEYGHRMLGRSLGVAFVLPLTYFSIRGMIPKHLYPRMAALLALGGGQVEST